MAHEVRVELLLSRRVKALNGRAIGRLEEMRAELVDRECCLREYLIGEYALFERLAAWPLERSLLRLFRLKKKAGGYRVPWRELDVSDLRRPKLRCSVDELAPLERAD